MRPLNQLPKAEIARLASTPLQERCTRIIDEFDEWLALRVILLKLEYADLPHLNDAFRDYFADTGTARNNHQSETPVSASPAPNDETPAITKRSL